MKKILAVLLAVVIFCIACGTTGALADSNLLQTNLSSSQGLLMDIESGYVSYSDRFNGNGALSAIADGDKDKHVDVYGAMDSSWQNPAYVGVLLTLDGIFNIGSIAITSGLANYPDTYRVYISNTLEELYTEENIAIDGMVCENNTQTASIGKSAKYIAVFCTEYVGNQRIKEIEIMGTVAENEPDVPSEDDYAEGLSVSGNQLKLGNMSVSLHGVNIPQFSWSADGDGSADTALYQAINEWECSIVRLAVDPNMYVNGGVGSGSGQTLSKTAEEFQDLIDGFVTELTNNGIAVVLDCHAYSGAYDTVQSFWDIAAPKYDSNELVMYGLVNEPISDWTVWYEGGDITLPDGTNKTSIGMPALIDRVRQYSDNVVVIGGIDWAFDISGISSSGLASLAAERASVLGISQAEYINAYSVKTGSREGRGIVLDTHIYSHKNMNWNAAIGTSCEEFPVLVGEYNPYFRNGIIDELNVQEKAFLQKIFRWITEKGFSSTSWSLGAEPFLTDHSGNITAIGTAVKQFVKDGEWECEQDENLIYQHFSSAQAICRPVSELVTENSNMFINQAHLNGEKIGNQIITNLIDGETATHYDIYPWDGYLMGMVYSLDCVYACYELRMTSGLDGYPDKYKIYASQSLENLYSDESLVENSETEHTGTVVYKIDKPVKYVAFLAEGYVRIKEFSLSGSVFGDMDSNYTVDSRDLSQLRKTLLGCEVRCVSAGDINLDSNVNVIDLIKLKKQLSK